MYSTARQPRTKINRTQNGRVIRALMAMAILHLERIKTEQGHMLIEQDISCLLGTVICNLENLKRNEHSPEADHSAGGFYKIITHTYKKKKTLHINKHIWLKKITLSFWIFPAREECVPTCWKRDGLKRMRRFAFCLSQCFCGTQRTFIYII